MKRLPFLPLFAALLAFAVSAGCATNARAKTDGTIGAGAHAYWDNGPGFDVKGKVPSLDLGAGNAIADPINGGTPAPAETQPQVCDPNDPHSPCYVPAKPPAAPQPQNGAPSGKGEGDGDHTWIAVVALLVAGGLAWLIWGRKPISAPPK